MFVYNGPFRLNSLYVLCLPLTIAIRKRLFDPYSPKGIEQHCLHCFEEFYSSSSSRVRNYGFQNDKQISHFTADFIRQQKKNKTIRIYTWLNAISSNYLIQSSSVSTFVGFFSVVFLVWLVSLVFWTFDNYFVVGCAMRFNTSRRETEIWKFIASSINLATGCWLITEKPSQPKSINFESNKFSECATIRHDFEQIADMPFVRSFGEAHKFRAQRRTPVFKHISWRKTACCLLKSSNATKICDFH